MYRLRTLMLSVVAGNEAARRKVKVWVEVSTGMVYKPDQVPRKEGDKTKPWLKMAKYKLMSEEELSKINGYISPSVPLLFHSLFVFAPRERLCDF